MDHKPLVSIVTPCFNSGQFIESCIRSVLAQDYPYVEHIIHDGASTDGTVEILKKYTGKVDWISEKDKGQSDGLNKALQRCKGDIILVLNADDELLPHAASWGVEQMAKHPDVAVVYGNQYTIDEQGKIIKAQKSFIPYDFHKLLCVELVPPAQAAFIRRSHFEQVGLYADAEIDTCPDYEMWVRIGLKFPMVYVPEFVTRYRWYHREFDSKQLRTIDRFIRSKREVMDKVFNALETEDSIRLLRNRAYSSLYIWAAGMAVDAGDIRSVFRYLNVALSFGISFKKLRRCAYLILGPYIYSAVVGIKRSLNIPVEID